MSVLGNLVRIADAEENLGESEVREAHLAKSLFYIRIGDKVDYFANLSPICTSPLQFASNWILNSGKSIGATQANRKQDSCCWTEDGLGVLHTAAWVF